MDIETPIEMLMQKDHRVCSAHFDKDDFIIESIDNPYQHKRQQ
jgi:hypothetical protein